MSYNVSHYETTVYPQPLFVQHGNRRGAILHCPLPDCVFRAYHYVSFHSHIENCHKCLACNSYVNVMRFHDCPTPNAQHGQIGGGHPLKSTDFTEISRSHMGVMAVYRYNGEFETLELEEAFSQIEEPTTELLTELWEIHNSMRLEIIMGVLMERTRTDEDGNNYLQQENAFFTSKHELHSPGEVELILISSAAEIIQKVDTFLDNGSQWYVKELSSFDVKIGEIRLFQNAKPEGWLPADIRRQGFINPYTSEPICFKLSVCISAFYERQRARNASEGLRRGNLKFAGTWKPYFSEFDWSSVTPHVDVYYGISKFEQANSCCVNLFTSHQKSIVLMRKSEADFPKIINLYLIVKKTKGRKIQTHFVGIYDIHKFLGSSWKHDRVWFCQRCFRHFKSEKAMTNHFLMCKGPLDYQPKEQMPKASARIEFCRPEMTLPFPVVFYFDYECFSQPVVAAERQKGKSTVLEYKYVPASYALCVAVQDSGTYNLAEVEYYDGEKPVQHFFQRVFELAEKYLNIIRRTNNFVQPTAEQLIEWEQSTECYLCHTPFESASPEESTGLPDIDWDDDDNFAEGFSSEEERDEDAKVNTDNGENKNKNFAVKCYHHRHYDGMYLGALCRACNLKIRYKHEIPLVAHGGSNFDFSILLNHMEGSEVDSSSIKVLAKSSEKIIEIQLSNGRDTLSPLRSSYGDGNESGHVCGNRKVRIRLLDNCCYLASSLSNLATALSKDGCKYWHMLTQSLPSMLPHLESFQPSTLDLVMEKLPYCYEYLSSPEVLKDGHPLPEREKWNNSLRNEQISDKDWGMVQRVCRELKLHDLRSFTRVYTILDTVLLCIINTNFRSLCLDVYDLDPLYCPTLSGYSWQAFLFKTRASIDHVRCATINKMVTDSIRGGLSFNGRRYAEANHELLRNYDPSKPRRFIMYYDINGLYANALTEAYPVGDFKLESVEKLKAIDWKTYDPVLNNNTGYFLRVKLGYPKSIQDYTSDLPLAPQKHSVKFEELPKFHQDLAAKLEGKIPKTFVTQERLLAHCYTRENYVLHHVALKFYIQMGLELLDIMEGFSFTEKAIFKPYVEFAIEMRRKAKSNAMNSLLKLSVNALYGRSLMSNKERLIIKFANSAARARQLLSNPRCSGFKIINQKTSMIMLRPRVIVLNNPVVLGATCLDRSKVKFYDSYYNKLKKMFGNDITMLACDTDSYLCEIRDADGTVLQKHIQHEKEFDFSKLKASSDLFTWFSDIQDLRMKNAGINGLIKIETITVIRAIFLKPKVYLLEEDDGQLEKRAKGVHKDVMKDIMYSTYENVYEKDDLVYVTARMIRSYCHNLFNISVKKLGFHSLAVSRAFISKNESLPFGHHRLSEM